MLGGQVGVGWRLTPNFVQRDVETTPDNFFDDSFDLVLNGGSHHLVKDSNTSNWTEFRTNPETFIRVRNIKNESLNSGRTNIAYIGCEDDTSEEAKWIDDNLGVSGSLSCKTNVELGDATARSGSQSLALTGNFDPDVDEWSRSIDLSGYTDVNISLWTSTEQTEPADNFTIYYWNESGWAFLTEDTRRDASNQVAWMEHTISIPDSAATSSFRLLVTWETSSTNEHMLLDDIDITGIPNYIRGYWLATTPDGTTYRFGYTNDSKNLAFDNNGDALSWGLDQVEDVYGNKIFYNYDKDPNPTDNGTLYLTNISYNNDEKRLVEFVYENRPDLMVSYNFGSKIQNSRRLKEITVKFDGVLVRKYVLSYSDYPYSDLSLLSSIQEYGSDGASTLPSISFDYQTGVVNLALDGSVSLDDVPFFEKNESGTIQSQGTMLVDVNGDALVDIVQSYRDSSTVKQVLLNTRNGWTDSGWNLTDVPVFFEKDDYGGQDYGVRVLDVDGDGLADILQSNGSKLLMLNNGSGWNQTMNWNLESLPAFVAGTDPTYGTGVRFLDANGDGLVDIFQSNDTSKLLLFNNGSGWFETDWDIYSIPAFVEGSPSKDNGVRVVDANGDGLPDIVQSYDNGTITKKFFINNGSGWMDFDFDLSETPIFTKKESGTAYDQGVFFTDLNADGLVDLLQSYNNGSTDIKKSFINTGLGWEEVALNLSTVATITTKDAGNRGYRLTDLNGDGISDLIQSFDNGTSYKKLWHNNATAGKLLKTINTRAGGTINFTYVPSTGFDNTGGDGISDLAFVKWLASSVTKDNGMAGEHHTLSTTSFEYGNGSYDFFEKEFRGFGDITVYHPDGSQSTREYHQDTARQGRIIKSLGADSNGNPYRSSVNEWLYDDTRGNYNVTYLNKSTDYFYDGSESNPKIASVWYTYDDYGNVIEKNLRGDTAVSGDEKHEHAVYGVNETAWILRKPCHAYLQDAAYANVSRSWLYYDDQSKCAVPLKGSLTKTESWLEGGENVNSSISYDSYGNVISSTNPRGYTANISYDAETHTFPVNTTNPLGHVASIAYDLGTGNVLNSTDANLITTELYYDVFGRPVKDVLPGDSNEIPTRLYEYYLDGVAPEYVKVVQNASTPAFYGYSFADGFGRTIQTRRPSEQSSLEIVSDTFYDSMSRIDKTSVPYYSSIIGSYSQPAGSYSMEMEYDPAGRLVEVTNPDGTTKTMAYDHWNITYTDETGSQIARHLNAYGEIVQVDEHNNGEVYNTSYNYSARGELTRIQDNASNVFLFYYDTLGRKTSMIDPDMGIWNYSYDSNGNLISQTDNKSIVTTLSYDALDRLNQSIVNNSLSYNYTYDTQFNGTLRGIDNPYDSYIYWYDNRYRKIKDEHVIDELSFNTSWGYDSMDRVKNLTYPDGEVVNFTYNNQGQLESLGQYLTDVDYNAVEKITDKRFENGIVTSYSYRPDNYRLSRILTPGLQDFNYTYDGVGNVLSIGNSLRGSTEYFGYDELHRLTSAYETDGYNLTYEYNPIGNLLNIRDDVLDYGSGAGPHALTSYTDNSAPEVSFTGSARKDNAYTNDDSPTITAAVNDNFGNASATLWWNGTNNFSMNSIGGTLFGVPMSNLGEGTYSYYVNVTDSAGNSDSSETRNITIDTTPPTISVVSPFNGSILDSVFTRINATASELVGGWSYSRGGVERVPFFADYILRYTKGENSFTALATDLAGNLGWMTSRFTVNVTTFESNPPQIRIVAPVASSFQAGDNVTFSILVVNYVDEPFADGLRITVKDPSGRGVERVWRRVWMQGKDVSQIRFEYALPDDAAAGKWLVRAEFTEDARLYASPTSRWFEVEG
ncbi:MAG TPA: hypothetical protein ENH10_03990 [Bacteroidetes bacterium]|nr:hypothetical protein [Bacteroidota bacterium]HEX04304.1 hypothetical protein [Bacteroidota bacterium]